MSQPRKSNPEKNWFEVSQSSILYVFSYKMCNPLELETIRGENGH